ncbi:MAG: cell wall-binding repeat-containing protein [Actinomycetia bacterium]|nr:cell wall-binding repeat-containing protein [Actinomycetes bacterium]
MRSAVRRGILALAVVALVLPAAAASAAPWPAGAVHVALDARRVAGPNRYDTSVAIARDGYPAWADVAHVVIASGETRALADAVSASGLVWAYDAPLLLVQRSGLPQVVRTALQEIRSANGTVTVTIVGGTAAVSTACANQIAGIVGQGSIVRPLVGADRYTTAAGVVALMRTAASETSRTMPPVALIANGSDASGFYDALALSAVSAKTGAPVLFVKKNAVPAATRSMLSRLAPEQVIVAGSTAAVDAAVFATVRGTARPAGVDRYGTAVAVARLARTRGWLGSTEVGVAGSVIDAASAASIAGRSGAPILFTESWRLSKAPSVYLAELGSAVASATVFGGPAALSDATLAQIEGAPAAPGLVAPASGGYVGKYAYVKIQTGVNTTQVDLYAGSSLVATAAVDGFDMADFGKRAMPASGVTFRVVATNPDGGHSARTTSYKRLSYPGSTSIVIDKSDFKLYWVKDDVLIKAYPIATGRASMETPPAIWKIMAKYKTDPASVYGPRKMRLFRRVVSGGSVRYVYTAYGIHGTNQPWVIGTKASHGCIRMYNADVLELWPQVPLGTVVQTRE